MFQILILTTIIVIIFTGYKYFQNPKRQLDKAKQRGEFYFLDEVENINKNFLFTYKGCLFEGEKHIGIASHSFEVTEVFIVVKTPLKLHLITKNDITYFEKEIHQRYPNAVIKWKYPIDVLLKQQTEELIL